MSPREIIAEAWAITRRERALWRWGMTFSLLETLLDIKLLSYQAYFLWSYLQGEKSGFWDIEIMLYRAVPFWMFTTFAIALLILIAVEYFIPHMAHGAIIGLAAKAYRGEEVKGGLLIAVYNFFPILAVHELFRLASTTTMLAAASLVLRYIPGDMKMPIIIGIIVLWAFSNILKFFASFAEPAIVIRRRSIFAGLGESFKLIISYMGHVIFLMLLLFVISIRILVNLVTVLLIPSIVIGIGMLMALFLSQVLSILIAALVGIALIFLASYFFAHLHVFKTTVWALAYMELSEKKDLHVIME